MATDLHALLLCAIIALQVLFGLVWLFTRRGPNASSTLKLLSEDLRASESRLEAALGRGVQAHRDDAARSARDLRGELNARFDALQQASGLSAAELRKEVSAGLDRFRRSLGEMSDAQDKRFSAVRDTLDAKVKELQESNESSKRCAKPWTKSFREPWRSVWASRSSSSANAWTPSTRGWARCRRWPMESAT